MVFINNYMDLHNDMRFYQEKFPSTHTTYSSIKDVVNRHDGFPYRHFGEDPHRLIAEYNLILMKQSNQPASVRKPILHICNIALNRLIEEKRKEMEENQEENNVKTK